MSRWGHAGARIVGMVLAGLGAIFVLCWSLENRLPVAAVSDIVQKAVSIGSSTDLMLSALHAGLVGFGGRDEAFRITNVSAVPIVLSDTWRVRDDSGDVIAFPAGGFTVGARSSIWCARNALSFTLAFGFTPALEYGTNSTPDVPDMELDSGFNFADHGGSVTLFRVALLDTANRDGGPWSAGSNVSGDRRSMERVDPAAVDSDANWGTSLSTTIGLDAEGDPIAGTPGHTNSVYVNSSASDWPQVVINEVAWAGTNASSYDEWIELHNNTDRDIDLQGWVLAAADGTPSIQLTGIIVAHGFYLLERTDDTTVANKTADQIFSGALENSGEILRLYQARLVDVMVYGDADPSRSGWGGPAVQPYDNGAFAIAGQILFRKRKISGLPVPDTNTAADWANDTSKGSTLYGPVREGDLYGKRAMYPGWDWEAYSDTFEVTATAHLTVGIAPDNVYTVVAALLNGARQSILIQGYTFESVWLTNILTERIAAGVQVTMLLEGAPAGGLSDQQLWNSERIVHSGGKVYFMHNDSTARIYDRYSNQHAKFMVVDDKRVALSTENFGNHAMPVDDKSNGTAGDRGVFVVTDQEDVVSYVRSLFARDCDPVHHQDIVAYGQVDRYTVPPTYTAVYSPGGGGYDYMAPFSATVPAFEADRFEVIHSPETSLRYSDGLIGLVLRAGPGDEVYVEQMDERLHWGPSVSDVFTDPNPRLEAYIQAARQGARVRVLLDTGFDDERKNYETAFYILNLARDEGLDLDVKLGNPTGRGIHSKLVLVRLGNEKYIHVGSINGSEASSKVNRELALQVRSDGAYDYVRRVFDYDWAHSAGPYEVRLPIIFRDYVPESDHVLISEVVFKLSGDAELGEWIEVYNPTETTMDIGGWLLGDAVHEGDYERLYAFPPGTAIPSRDAMVIARYAQAYQSVGYVGKLVPDFELNDSNAVPDMIPVSWGTGELALGNTGDEVLLLDPLLRAVDVLVYGSGGYPGVAPFHRVEEVHNGSSLERWPANRDSNDCSRDFRIRYAPDPGHVVTW